MHPTHLFGMETDRHNPDAQKATNHEGGVCGMKQQSPASFPAAPPQFLKDLRPEEDTNILALIERAKVQRRRKRGARLATECQLYFEDGLYAQSELSNHIWQSLPLHLRASQASLHRFWFSIHHKVSLLALNQALRSARRLGLKRVEDKPRFLAENCRWYVAFCRCSCWLTSSFA